MTTDDPLRMVPKLCEGCFASASREWVVEILRRGDAVPTDRWAVCQDCLERAVAALDPARSKRWRLTGWKGDCTHPSVTGGNCDACGKAVAVNGHVAGCHASGLGPGRSCGCAGDGPGSWIHQMARGQRDDD